MKIGVPKETAEGERRVALVPDVVKALTAKEIEVASSREQARAPRIPTPSTRTPARRSATTPGAPTSSSR